MKIYTISGKDFGIAVMESITANSEIEAKNIFLSKHTGFKIYAIIQL